MGYIGLGPLIRRFRLKKRMTLTDLASYVEVESTEISLYERELKSPPLCNIYAIFNCLNIPPELLRERPPEQRVRVSSAVTTIVRGLRVSIEPGNHGAENGPKFNGPTQA